MISKGCSTLDGFWGSIFTFWQTNNLFTVLLYLFSSPATRTFPWILIHFACSWMHDKIAFGLPPRFYLWDHLLVGTDIFPCYFHNLSLSWANLFNFSAWTKVIVLWNSRSSCWAYEPFKSLVTLIWLNWILWEVTEISNLRSQNISTSSASLINLEHWPQYWPFLDGNLSQTHNLWGISSTSFASYSMPSNQIDTLNSYDQRKFQT